MWTCPTCGEQLQPQFKTCWNCAGGEVAPTEPVAEESPQTVSVYGRRIPWPFVIVVALLVLMLLDAMVAARGTFSRLPAIDIAWLGYLFANGVGVLTRSERILRMVAVLMVLGGISKVALLFIVTASSANVESTEIARAIVSALLLWGSSAVLWFHLARIQR